MTRPPGIDLSYRPDTYWPESLTQEQLIARISGSARQAIATAVLEARGFAGLTAFVARETLDTEQRAAWGRVHPYCMGGEYLPPMQSDEVEIVRISLKSVTADQISIRARREPDRILYRVVGEYEEDEGMRHQLPFSQSSLPLTLAELIELMDGSDCPGDLYSGGVVLSHRECAFDWNSDVGEALDFVSIGSGFYPQLDAWYETVAQRWSAEKLSELEEEGDEA